MGFSSISFLFYFLPPFFLVYYLVPRRLKNIVALLGSLAFYAWGEPSCFLLIAAATLANYGLGLWMRRARRLALAFGLTLDLGLLFLFKYLGFFAGIFGAGIAPAGAVVLRISGAELSVRRLSRDGRAGAPRRPLCAVSAALPPRDAGAVNAL